MAKFPVATRKIGFKPRPSWSPPENRQPPQIPMRGAPPRHHRGQCLITALKRNVMPEKQTLERARRDREQGKAPSTQAGEFVREEMHHIREGKHGARSAKQAIAIGLSKARRAGVNLKPPAKGRVSAKS